MTMQNGFIAAMLTAALYTSALAADMPAASAEKKAPEAKMQKAPAPSKKAKKLMEAYGTTKQYCCEMPGICISGPVDGSKVCEELGGKPFSEATCSGRKCIDP